MIADLDTIPAPHPAEALAERLLRAVEERDPEGSSHAQRMSRYCGLIAGALGLDANAVRSAAVFHDIGKLAIPDAILRKPGQLTVAEQSVMETHTVIGHQLLTGASSVRLEPGAQVALTHHERWDGNGYPHGRPGETVPLVGRIAAVADTVDILTTPRPHRQQTLGLDEAVAYVWQERGRAFDPAVALAVLEGAG